MIYLPNLDDPNHNVSGFKDFLLTLVTWLAPHITGSVDIDLDAYEEVLG